jgi:hypothetical protein
MDAEIGRMIGNAAYTEAEARDWIERNGGPGKVRDMARAFGWSKSRVGRFLSRLSHGTDGTGGTSGTGWDRRGTG